MFFIVHTNLYYLIEFFFTNKFVLLSLFRALAIRCNNAPNPDKYGHYREVSIVQIKHHWWWKVSYIFIYLLNFSKYLKILELK